MFDFFDEDFPLTKKQEEEYKRRLAEESEAVSEAADEIAAQEAEKAAEVAQAPDASPAQPDEDVVIEDLPKELFSPAEVDDEEDEEDAQPEPPANEAYAQQLEKIMDDEPAPEQPEEIGGETDDGELVGEKDVGDVAPEPEMTPYDEMFDGEADDGELAEDIPEEEAEYADGGLSEDVLKEEAESADDEPAEDAPEPESDEAQESPDEAASLEEPKAESVLPTPADYDLSEKDFAVSPEALAFDDSLASINALEQHLREELKNLGEKLESMERAVDSMEDAEIAEGFDYEYDERYFAVEETPAYQHPEMCRPAQDEERFDDEYDEVGEHLAAAEPVQTVTEAAVEPLNDPELENPPREEPERTYRIHEPTRAEAKAAPARVRDGGRDININLNSSTLIKAGAVVAAAALAYKLLSGKDKKD